MKASLTTVGVAVAPVGNCAVERPAGFAAGWAPALAVKNAAADAVRTATINKVRERRGRLRCALDPSSICSAAPFYSCLSAHRKTGTSVGHAPCPVGLILCSIFRAADSHLLHERQEDHPWVVLLFAL